MEKIENTFLDNFSNAVKKALEDTAIEIITKHKKQIDDELSEYTKEMVAKVAIDFSSRVKIDTFGNELTIKIWDTTRESFKETK